MPEAPMSEPHVVVLGAGPAGVGGARQLRVDDSARVTVLEQRDTVGGNAGSFEFSGQRVDYGSHRLHPACEPEILSDIQGFLGDELVRRQRHGRIRLRGRWIHFPLKPVDLLLRLDRAFALGAARDAVLGFLPGGGRDYDEASFASVLEDALGPTICRSFYFPYARKIWGEEPEDLSAVQARRRVAANSVGKLIRKVAGKLPGVTSVGFDHFYYPEGGYGRISEAYAEDARRRGAELLLGWRAGKLERDGAEGGWRVHAERGEERRVLDADHVWSTIPIPALARIVRPSPPPEVVEAARAIRYRSMLLVYLTLEENRFTEYDAHYFPGPETAITRLSEPKNYAGVDRPAGRTTLCAELPCEVGTETWEMDEGELARLVTRDLEAVGIAPSGPPSAVHVERLSHAYPIYLQGYEEPFDLLDEWVRTLPGLLTYGRQGLFAHDNTHHALAMAYAAADCFGEDGFDRERWSEYREEFESHVVVD